MVPRVWDRRVLLLETRCLLMGLGKSRSLGEWNGAMTGATTSRLEKGRRLFRIRVYGFRV